MAEVNFEFALQVQCESSLIWRWIQQFRLFNVLCSASLSRRKYEICVWKIAHFGIKYFPLTIITFTIMFVLLYLNLYYFLNMFYCTNVKKVNRTRIGSWAWRSTCLLLWLLLWLGLLVLWLYITLNAHLSWVDRHICSQLEPRSTPILFPVPVAILQYDW